MQELKVNIENAVYLRSQLASQYEDVRRRLEDEDRVSFLKIKFSCEMIQVELIFFSLNYTDEKP